MHAELHEAQDEINRRTDRAMGIRPLLTIYIPPEETGR